MAKSGRDDDIKACGCGCGITGNHEERATWLRVDQRRIGGTGFSLALFGKIRFATVACFHTWAFLSRTLQKKFEASQDRTTRAQILKELRAIGWQYQAPKKS